MPAGFNDASHEPALRNRVEVIRDLAPAESGASTFLIGKNDT
ncbi:hypothetical protein [Caballeronia sp. GAFFF1]|nr:hypothetical protein [Caballeronia sp. GAFFF1]